jgi:hypothetical protein
MKVQAFGTKHAFVDRMVFIPADRNLISMVFLYDHSASGAAI